MKKLLLLSLLFPLLLVGQTQIGQDIDGETFDYLGTSVSLSSDGSVLAVGAPLNEGTTQPGYVQIYENINGIWTQVGQDIDSEAGGDRSGWSVSLSSDGSIVAIGAPGNDDNGVDSGHVRVYQNNSGVWTQLGQDIDGEAAGDISGDVSLSSDGSIVAIGARSNDGIRAGHVRVYQNNSGVWSQLGQDIDGEAADDGSGSSVSLSSDGSIVAIGAILNDGNGDRSGHVRIYKNQSNNWVQIGQDIDGEAAGDRSGWSVSLSSDGSVVAIGAFSNAGNGVDSGHVRVYQNNSGVWTQLGQDIDGEAADDGSGSSVSLSSDGSIVAIGAIANDGNGFNSGHVRIYKNQSNNWVQIGQDIDGEASVDLSGRSVSLSSDGSIVAIGASSNDGNLGPGNNTGHVRVYDLSAVLSTESFNVDYFSYYPNPVKEVLNINLNPGLELKQVNLYNILGAYLYSTKSTTINTNNLNSGLYFIEVLTDQGKSSKKIIVE